MSLCRKAELIVISRFHTFFNKNAKYQKHHKNINHPQVSFGRTFFKTNNIVGKSLKSTMIRVNKTGL